MIPTRQCNVCFDVKIIEEFPLHKGSKWGFRALCFDCERIRVANRYEAHKVEEQAKKRRAYRAKQTPRIKGLDARLKFICQKSEQRTKFEDYEISPSYLSQLLTEQDNKCQYSGVTLTPESCNYHTMSLDRIDSSIGYVKGNVQLVCHIVNIMKNQFPEEVFIEYCSAIAETNKRKTT